MIVRKIKMNEHRQKIEDKLKERNGYCPCSLIKNDDTKCMCKNFRNQIENREAGKCHCGLYEVILEESDK